MRTRSSSNLPVESPPNPSTSNPKHRNRRRSKQPFILEESPVDTMTDQRTMAELLRAPTEGYAEAIMVPPILTEQFELKHSLINMMTSDQFFRLEKDNAHDHIRCTLNPADQDSLNSDAGGNLLERHTQDALTIIKNKSKVCNSRIKSVVSQVKSSDANSNSSFEISKLTHAVNQQTSAVTTAMTAILKQFQATLPLASVKAVEEICVTCGGAHLYYQCLVADGNTFPEFRDNIQGYVAAAAFNYNQGNSGYRPLGMANQIRPPGFAQPNVQNNQNRFGQPQGYNRGTNFNQDQSYQVPTQQNQSVPLSELEKIKRVNKANIKAMQTQINNVKNELRNEIKNLIQASMSNQTNELKNMMASFFQMNTASTSGSGSLPSNTIANPKGKLKSITTRSGIVLDGPFIPIPPPFINPEEDKRVEETLTNQDLTKYTIKKMVKALLSNKEKLLKLANTPLNENCSAVILKKLLEKLGDPGKFLIPCGFSKLKCKALADLANFVIVDYESDPRVPLILGRPFLRTVRALIDIYEEEMILHDESRVHVPNVLTTHPTLMLDSDLIPSNNSLPKYKIFYFDIEEKNSGSTTIHADISLSNLESFNFDFKPDPVELTRIPGFRRHMKDFLRQSSLPRLHLGIIANSLAGATHQLGSGNISSLAVAKIALTVGTILHYQLVVFSRGNFPH
nr:hypothetical protein [Tanacetum cinerariifolium]